MVRDIPVGQWAESFQDFTKRNAGRRVLLEVDDVDFGAQQQGTLPLMGIAYDRHDSRIDIMLGRYEGDSSHLSRSIPAALAVEVLTDRSGRDQALRIAHRRQQTLLVFLEE